MRAFPGFERAAPGFDEPLEMLAACHGRIEAQLVTLERLVPHLAANGCDAAARDAARAVMRYFDTAGANHHRDEDEDLFPLLRARAAGRGDAELPAILDVLQREHAGLEAAYAALRPRLLDIADARAAALEERQVGRLAQLYRAHVAREAESVLPFAAQVLTGSERATLSARMAARRGASPARIGG